MCNISNLEHRLEADAFLSNVAFRTILNLFRAMSDATECFYILFLEANLIAVDAHLPCSFRTNYVEGKRWNNIIPESVVIRILNQFQNEMGLFLIKLIGKSISFSYILAMTPVILHVECPIQIPHIIIMLPVWAIDAFPLADFT